MQDEIAKYFKKMRRSFSHFIILSIYNQGEEIHGYELKKRIEMEFGDSSKEFFETDSSIYPVLTDLKRKGLLDYRERIISGRTQKLYFITDKGKEILPEMERQYMFFNMKIRGFFSRLADQGFKVSFQVNIEELEGQVDNKLLNLTLYDLKQSLADIPTKEMKLKYIEIIKEKIALLQDELKKLEKNVKLL